MPLIFVGGARGSGKTTLIRALRERMPHVEHVVLAQEVNSLTPAEMYNEEYVGMRRLTPDQQYEAVSKVIERLARNAQENPSRIIFVDGHYISSSFVDNHQSLFPLLRDNARLFDLLVWIRIKPEQILHRRFIRERIPRPLDLTVKEYVAEGIEARFLEKHYGTKLIVRTDSEFFRAIFAQLGRYLTKQIEDEGFPLQRRMEIVLRMLRGEAPSSLSREIGVSERILVGWWRRFLAAGAEALEKGPPGNWDRVVAREIARLQALVRKITKNSHLLEDPTRPRPDSSVMFTRPMVGKHWPPRKGAA